MESVPTIANRLEPVRANDHRWRLPKHAHIVVYEREPRGLLTIYDCGATQKPPSAQLLGDLESIEGRAAVGSNPTDRVVRLRERSVLERAGDDRYRIVRD